MVSEPQGVAIATRIDLDYCNSNDIHPETCRFVTHNGAGHTCDCLLSLLQHNATCGLELRVVSVLHCSAAIRRIHQHVSGKRADHQ